jgi:hypothetical protein
MQTEVLHCVWWLRPADGHDLLRAIGLLDLVPYILLYPASMPKEEDVMPQVMQAILSL